MKYRPTPSGYKLVYNGGSSKFQILQGLGYTVCSISLPTLFKVGLVSGHAHHYVRKKLFRYSVRTPKIHLYKRQLFKKKLETEKQRTKDKNCQLQVKEQEQLSTATTRSI